MLASYFISLAKRSYEDRERVSQSCLCDTLITKKLFLDTMRAIRKQNDLMFKVSAGKITHRLLTVNWMGVPERFHAVDW